MLALGNFGVKSEERKKSVPVSQASVCSRSSFYYQKYLALHKNIYTGSRPGGAAEETLRQGQGAEAGAEEQQQEKR